MLNQRGGERYGVLSRTDHRRSVVNRRLVLYRTCDLRILKESNFWEGNGLCLISV